MSEDDNYMGKEDVHQALRYAMNQVAAIRPADPVAFVADKLMEFHNERLTIGTQFRKWDENGDGSISSKELVPFCRELNVRPWKAFALLDSNPDGRIQFEEFLRWWLEDRNGSDEDIQAKLDEPKKKTPLTRRAELAKSEAVTEARELISDAELYLCDFSGSRSHSSNQATEAVEQLTVEDVYIKFDHYDRNDNGQVELSELHLLCQDMNIPSWEALYQLDQDGNNVVEKEDFVTFWLERTFGESAQNDDRIVLNEDGLPDLASFSEEDIRKFELIQNIARGKLARSLVRKRKEELGEIIAGNIHPARSGLPSKFRFQDLSDTYAAEEIHPAILLSEQELQQIQEMRERRLREKKSANLVVDTQDLIDLSTLTAEDIRKFKLIQNVARGKLARKFVEERKAVIKLMLEGNCHPASLVPSFFQLEEERRNYSPATLHPAALKEPTIALHRPPASARQAQDGISPGFSAFGKAAHPPIKMDPILMGLLQHAQYVEMSVEQVVQQLEKRNKEYQEARDSMSEFEGQIQEMRDLGADEETVKEMQAQIPILRQQQEKYTQHVEEMKVLLQYKKDTEAAALAADPVARVDSLLAQAAAPPDEIHLRRRHAITHAQILKARLLVALCKARNLAKSILSDNEKVGNTDDDVKQMMIKSSITNFIKLYGALLRELPNNHGLQEEVASSLCDIVLASLDTVDDIEQKQKLEEGVDRIIYDRLSEFDSITRCIEGQMHHNKDGDDVPISVELISDDSDEKLRALNISYWNTCTPENPFDDISERLIPSLYQVVAAIQGAEDAGHAVTFICFTSWLNQLPDWVALFPPSYRASKVPFHAASDEYPVPSSPYLERPESGVSSTWYKVAHNAINVNKLGYGDMFWSQFLQHDGSSSPKLLNSFVEKQEFPLQCSICLCPVADFMAMYKVQIAHKQVGHALTSFFRRYADKGAEHKLDHGQLLTEAKSLFTKYDTDSSGSLDHNESLKYLNDFVHFFNSCLPSGRRLSQNEMSKFVHDANDEIDANKDGTLSWEEFKPFLESQLEFMSNILPQLSPKV